MLDYSSIGSSITVRVPLDTMSIRDKWTLCAKLMGELGLTERLLYDDQNVGKAFNKIWEEQSQKTWK